MLFSSSFSVCDKIICYLMRTLKGMGNMLTRFLVENEPDEKIDTALTSVR